MSHAKKLENMKFGRLTVIERFYPSTKEGKAQWLCKCDCGNTKIVHTKDLTSGHVVSCGCRRQETLIEVGDRVRKIPKEHKGIYSTWKNMRDRCNNPNCPEYHCYGGRGISVCKEWDDSLKFIEWATSHGYKNGLSIDRIDNDGNYCPENCQFLTVSENAKKKAKKYLFDGKEMTRQEISVIAGWHKLTLNSIINQYGFDYANKRVFAKTGKEVAIL